jgi:DNA-binding NarL/FixJ family response regulator
MEEDLKVIGHYENPSKVATQIGEYNPDVVIMDIDMPKMNGIEALKEIRKTKSEALVLMLTVFDDEDRIFESIQSGANGFLLKESKPKKIIEAIRDVIAGGAPMTGSVARKVLQQFTVVKPKDETIDLSKREKEILSFLVNGMSYKMIASQCSISYHTVNAHIRKIYDKLHVSSATEAVAKAMKNRLI